MPKQPTNMNMASSLAFRVAYQKQVFEIEMPVDETVLSLKNKINELTGIEPALQKLLYKGILKDEATLIESNLSNACKVVLMASSAKAILSIAAPAKPVPTAEATKDEKMSLFFEDIEHARVLKKGKPEFIIEKGISVGRSPLPSLGVIAANARGLKARLSFIDDSQEMQLATAERTQKISYTSIRKVQSEDMPADSAGEGYCALGIQIGPTEKSMLWFYWVPKQYVENIKDALGLYPVAQQLFNQIFNP
ncbi:hypothetical protein BJ741DRAFT_602106 [Chytriomyces cf. hyalinus JEL632]|nr:hypothetical protein BJ741DRAFT_602106 [Chytriomyces cf. hyalinus JEL632]